MILKHTQHSEIIEGITYTLAISEEDVPVRGNVLACGDNEEDRKAEDEVLAQLNRGNLWAWCTVWVTASVEHAGISLEADDTLGCCSYRDAAEFMQEGGYYSQMRDEALANLRQELEHIVESSRAAQEVLDTFPAFAK